MLVAIAILGLGGAALALRAKTFIIPGLYYCTTASPARGGNYSCVLGPYNTTGMMPVATSSLYVSLTTFSGNNCTYYTTVGFTTVYCTIHPLTAFLND